MFKIFTTEELIVYCKNYKWIRKPKEIHWHHTWKPNYSNFNGKNHIQLQEGMKNSHINDRGFSDIGQHLTLMPDGKWVTGRDFNQDPASISGRNSLGFAVEMLGDFDSGKDKIKNEQLNSAIIFGVFLIKFFGLSISNNIFHREYAKKTCPGTGIDKNWFVGLINDKLNPIQEEEYKMTKQDADKLIDILSAFYGLIVTEEDKNEIHRLANELRKASGQKTT